MADSSCRRRDWTGRIGQANMPGGCRTATNECARTVIEWKVGAVIKTKKASTQCVSASVNSRQFWSHSARQVMAGRPEFTLLIQFPGLLRELDPYFIVVWPNLQCVHELVVCLR